MNSRDGPDENGNGPMSEMFPGEDMILARINEIGWEDRYVFLKILAAGNGIISILPLEGFERWQMHQRWNREMHAARAAKLRIPMVIGFFRSGEAEELSLFEPARFKTVSGNQLWDGYIIGRGCEDMVVEMWADWSTNVDQPFDADFSMGGEENYVASTREYVRVSASGRHHYRLKVGMDNRITDISIVDMADLVKKCFEAASAREAA